MKEAIKIISSVVLLTSLFGLAGCSDEQVEKWDKAADAVGDAAKETAKDVKEGVQEVARNAKPTDPNDATRSESGGYFCCEFHC